MDLLQGFIQPPKAQSVDDTIPTLCDRVENATLIGDRRSAVLALKAFSRDYREAVIASGLKPLISTLRKDSVDEDSVKAILETLLILFIRGEGNADLTRNWISQQSRLQNGKYPSPLVMKQEHEAVDQFSLWIADFMTQTDELVHLFIQLLESGSFHIRLYTTQLLEAFVASRPTRTREAIISIPVGVSTLVSLLDDIHEPVRDEAVLLLMAVANKSAHIQKLVAFENIFQKLFAIIKEEGGLRGSLVISDCLSLIVNILRYNTSNQTLFLESGNLPQMAALLNEPMEEEFFWNDQRLLNIKTALEIIKLTTEPHNTSTPRHQQALFDSHLLMIVLRLALLQSTPNAVRPRALLTAADMIRDNNKIQSELRKIDVPLFDPSLSVSPPKEERILVPVTELLLTWCFFANSIHTFEVRYASSELLKAYLVNNAELKIAFVTEQVAIYNESNDLSGSTSGFTRPCIFSVLFDYDPELKLNPYKLFFATDLMMFLFEDEEASEIRVLVRKVKNVDFSTEEEKYMSPVQTISDLLLTTFAVEDPRVPISYLCLLIFWIFDDTNAVDDFLSNRPVIDSLLSSSSHIQEDDNTVSCLVSMLLGVAYEFSTAASSLPRAEFYELLVKSIGMDNYSSKIQQFKESSLFSSSEEHESISIGLETDSTGLPKMYFSSFFRNLVKDNYYRIQTAMKRGPEVEIIGKISFESYEELQIKASALNEELKKTTDDYATQVTILESSLKSLKEDLEKAVDEGKMTSNDLENLRKSYNSLKEDFLKVSDNLDSLEKEKDDLEATKIANENKLKELEHSLRESNAQIQKLERDIKTIKDGKTAAEDGINKMNRELLKLSKEHNSLKNTSSKTKVDLENSICSLKEKLRKQEEYNLEIQSKLQSGVTKNQELSKENTFIKSEKEECQKEILKLKTRLDSQDALVAKLTVKLKELAEKCKGVEIAKVAKDQEMEKLTDKNKEQLSKLEDKAQKLKDQLAVEERQKDDAKSEVAQLIRTIEENAQMQDKLGLEGKALRADIDRLSAEVKASESQRNDAKNKLSQAMERIASLDKELKDTTHSHDKIVGELGMTSTKLDKVNEKLITIEKEKTALADECKKKEEEYILKVESLNSEKLKLEAKVSDLQKCLNDEKLNWDRTTASLESEIERLKEVENTSSSSMNELVLKVQSLEKVKDELISKNKAIHEEMQDQEAKLKSDLNATRQDSASTQARISKLESEHAEVALRAEQLEKKLAASKEKQLELENDLKEAVDQGMEKDGKVTKLIEEIAEAKADLKEKAEEIRILSLEKSKLEDSYKRSMEELSRYKSSASDERQGLENEVTMLRNKLKDKCLEFEKERKLLNEGSTSVTEDYSNKVSSLEKKLDSLEAEYSSKRRDFENEQNELRALLAKSEKAASKTDAELQLAERKLSDVEKMMETKENEVKELQISKDSEVAEVNKSLGKLKQTIKEKNSKLQELEKALDEKNHRISELTEETAAQKKELIEKESGLAKIEESNTVSRKQLQSEKDAAIEKIESLQQNYNTCLSERNKLEAQLLSSRDELALNASNLKQLESEKSNIAVKMKEYEECAEELAGLRAAKIKLEERVDVLERGNNKLSTDLISTQEQLQKASDKLEKSDQDLALRVDCDTQNQQLNAENCTLKEELKKWKEKAEDRAEIDELMLLVTELDEKNSKYRAKLEALGGECTSDEEEEDDDD